MTTVDDDRSRYLVDQSVMSHYRTKPTVERVVDQFAVSGVLCSCAVTMDEAQFSARNSRDLKFLTNLYGSVFHWLPCDEEVESQVARIRAALWAIGAGRGAQTTDVQIAATALRHDAIVVHNDTDFITIQRAVPELRQLRLRPDEAE
ncbi:type II toxin-antitoxin system VapC family toxin [Nocardia mexicana]|uniref:Putative nucleic acid-binding protein n=1 Tax=Nocardia mexicana TaxID=279262 RepID=A0A370H8V3_9NOCA|nr:PIN domain-containing protein [Nocardia mexicana]RDI53098.1 putative nucleic acid-binding protein [Nocardia mexicana]